MDYVGPLCDDCAVRIRATEAEHQDVTRSILDVLRPLNHRSFVVVNANQVLLDLGDVFLLAPV